MTSKNIDLQVLRAMASYYAQAIEALNFRADGTKCLPIEAMDEVSRIEYILDDSGKLVGSILRMREARAEVTIDLWNLRVTVRREGDVAETSFRWTDEVDRLEMTIRNHWLQKNDPIL